MRVSRFFSVNAQCVVAADRTVLSCSCLTVGAARKHVLGRRLRWSCCGGSWRRCRHCSRRSLLSPQGLPCRGVAGQVVVAGAHPAQGLERQRRSWACSRHAAPARRRRGSAPATTTPRRPARGLQTGSSGGRSQAASERRPRQHRIRRATPSARAADAGVGLLAWRTRPTRRPETQPLAQSGEAVRRGGAERCRGTPLQRSAGRWRCLLHENAAVKNGRSTLLRCDLF